MNTTLSTGSKSIYKFIVFKNFLIDNSVHPYGIHLPHDALVPMYE